MIALCKNAALVGGFTLFFSVLSAIRKTISSSNLSAFSTRGEIRYKKPQMYAFYLFLQSVFCYAEWKNWREHIFNNIILCFSPDSKSAFFSQSHVKTYPKRCLLYKEIIWYLQQGSRYGVLYRFYRDGVTYFFCVWKIGDYFSVEIGHLERGADR
jgi:hypothetical protein